jgi:hypothetical protein
MTDRSGKVSLALDKLRPFKLLTNYCLLRTAAHCFCFVQEAWQLSKHEASTFQKTDFFLQLQTSLLYNDTTMAIVIVLYDCFL